MYNALVRIKPTDFDLIRGNAGETESVETQDKDDNSSLHSL